MTPVEEYTSQFGTLTGSVAIKSSKQLSDTAQRIADGVAKEPTDNDAGITWSEFTQNTTFHGIRYIFDRSPTAYNSRR